MKPYMPLALTCALLSTASAQDLFATRHAPARIAKYDGADGSLVNGRIVALEVPFN